MIELTGGAVKSDEVGNKAFFLNQMLSLHIPVPPTAVVPIGDGQLDVDALRGWLVRTTHSDSNFRLAIRSSSAIEDSATESKAGHYLSLLGDFSIDSIPSAIA